MPRALSAVAFACAFFALSIATADARPRHQVTASHTQFCGDRYCSDANTQTPQEEGTRRGRRIRMARGDATILPHPAGCPGRLFCGCGVSVKIFGRPVRDLFLAANWRRFPPASCGAGMVAWRWGHVMAIENCHGNGMATVYDPNSGGRLTRRHTRSLAGYRIVNPHGSRMASR